jgi:hypothetical protein
MGDVQNTASGYTIHLQNQIVRLPTQNYWATKKRPMLQSGDKRRYN